MAVTPYYSGGNNAAILPVAIDMTANFHTGGDMAAIFCMPYTDDGVWMIVILQVWMVAILHTHFDPKRPTDKLNKEQDGR
jgi:hypothetical protein